MFYYGVITAKKKPNNWFAYDVRTVLSVILSSFDLRPLGILVLTSLCLPAGALYCYTMLYCRLNLMMATRPSMSAPRRYSPRMLVNEWKRANTCRRETN